LGCDRSSALGCHLNVALCNTWRESNKVWKNRLLGVKVGLETLICPETQRSRVMESMTKTRTDSNHDALEPALNDLKAYVQRAARQGVAAHEAEAGIWHRVLQLGHQALGLLFHLVGPGDVGETVVLPDGQEVRRLETPHPRVYQSVFGRFQLERVVYGTRAGQKIAYVPFDTQLQLPESDFSYLLQDWAQSVAMDQAYRQVPETLGRILDVHPSVDSLERMNRKMAKTVRPFRESRLAPAPEDEGAMCVVSADGKGIPIQRVPPEASIQGHDPQQEAKTNRKKMAVVGTVYTLDPLVRTPEEVVESLFRLPEDHRPAAERPVPQHKRLWASLPHEQDGREVSATEQTFGWLAQEVARRNPEAAKPILLLMDGQKSLWDAGQRVLPQVSTIEILDLLHATPRIWDAAHLFYGGDEEQALSFVYDRVLRLLKGEVPSVVAGLRQMGTKRKLRGKKRDKLAKICGYLENNTHRMHYDVYLAAGYPIASGVIEGACRHFIKDRMERSGMRWTIESAQAMLDVRSTYLNGDWDDFMRYRIEQETQRLYPYRALVEPSETLEVIELPLAA